MNSPKRMPRTALLVLAAATSALISLACSSSSEGPATISSEALVAASWVGSDTGLLQCGDGKVETLDDAIWELDVAGIESLDARQGTPRLMNACTECTCSALVYNFIAIKDEDIAVANTLGYAVFADSEIFFY